MQTTDYLLVRREPLLDEASYRSSLRQLIEESIPGYEQTRDDPHTDEIGRGSMRWQISRDRLSHTLLLYSGGEDLSLVRDSMPALLNAVDDHLNNLGAVLSAFDLGTQTYYVEALWLLSLTRLLGLGEDGVERVANFYAADESNDGADELFETLLAKLGRKSFPAEGLIHEEPYRLLLDCIKAEPENRPALMAQFLKRWYKGQRECDWWGSHVPRKGTKVLDTGFFGYWAFEAALVTFLWDIDDRSYRDLPHYPKDLVEFARAGSGSAASTAAVSERVLGGHVCPRAGWWRTPAEGSRRHFQNGELMPSLGGDYGTTIWQWDDNQAP